RIYYRNCFNEGLPIIVCPEAVDAISMGDEIEVDFESGVIKAGGKEFKFPAYPEFVQGLIKDGGLIPHVKKSLGLA
ncbi:MAG: 3-isopropylmalate dehydratase, partial [Synergistaceae bacterium]|nr:3-isopropylmalate dehydratase [Synergistaceae bacterium]